MITGVAKQSQFGVDGTHHKIMSYTYDKDSGKCKFKISSFPSQSISNSNKTPLLITEISVKLADLPTDLKRYLNDARDLLENYTVTLADWSGGIVS